MENNFKGTSVLMRRTVNRSRGIFTALAYIQAVFEVSVSRTFVHYKSATLIRLMYAEFGLPYTAN
jgi:hypothetical protein